jgi:hypothetical protein
MFSMLSQHLQIAAGLPADKKRQYSLPGTVEESIDQVCCAIIDAMW